MKRYRYTLSLDDASPTVVTPILEDNQVFEYEKDSDQVFIRKKLGGAALMFCNNDYQIIRNAPFETEFTIVKELLQSSGSYQTVFTGIFYKTDCEFDLDRLQVTVQPEPLDSYKKVVEGLDREFNLIDLAPPTVEFDYFTQPVFQVYEIDEGAGRSILTNIYGGVQFEQEVIEAQSVDLDLESIYHFGYLGTHGVILSDSLDPVIPLEYCDDDNTPPNPVFRSKDGTHTITRIDVGADFQWVIKDAAGIVVYDMPLNTIVRFGTFTSKTSGSTCVFRLSSFYGRLITGLEEIDGTSTNLLPEEDFVTTSDNYTHALPIGDDISTSVGVYGQIWQDVIIASSENSETPDKYGKIADDAFSDAGNYFNRPTGNGNGGIYPLQASVWEDSSYWFQYNDTLRDYQSTGARTRTQYNAYKLVDVLQSILTALDTGLTFEESTDCSEFYFDESNTIRTEALTAIITPKSNIIVGEYNVPAQKAPIKLSDVLNLMYGAHKCKWDIVGTNFKVESAEYYHRGMSYSSDNVGTDLTGLLEPKTQRSWTYKTNKWKYDKPQIPGQIRFSWMDDGSDVFDGFPIEINSKFADQGNIEEINIGLFTSDIDYIQLAPENISKDGFFFGEAETVAGRLTLPFVDLDLGNTGEFKLQNGYASMIYLQDQYHKYVLPASDVTVNLEDTTAESVKRTRIQEFTSNEGLPSDVVSDENLMKLVTTELGPGLIRSYSDYTNGGGSELIIEHDIDL